MRINSIFNIDSEHYARKLSENILYHRQDIGCWTRSELQRNKGRRKL